MLPKILRKLNEPFPSHESLTESLRTCAWIGLFIAFFLYFFMPIGPVDGTLHAMAICAGFGVVTFLCALSWDLLLKYGFGVCMDGPSWTLWKWIVSCMGLICLIAAGNLLFVDWLNPNIKLTMSNYLEMLRGTVMVGIFPCVFSGLMVQVRANERYRLEAEAIKAQSSKAASASFVFQLSADETLNIESQNLLFIEAMQNYVQLNYLENGTLKQSLMRSTLAALEQELSQQADSYVRRCHRSYLVNLKAVISVSGNAQGLKLLVRQTEEMYVPVSRAYIPDVKEALEQAA